MEAHRELDRAIERIMSIEIDQMSGDNLAVTLCSYFEDADDESEADDCGWKQSAIEAYEATKAEIASLFVPVREALAAHDAELAEVRSERDKLAALVRGWHYLAVGPDEMGDYYTHKQLVKASEPYASPALKTLSERQP